MKKTSVLLSAAFDDDKTYMLLTGKCDAIFSASVIRKSGVFRILYDTAGYKSLSGFRNLSASAVLSTVENVLRLTEKCEDYLFMLGEYVLSPDTVFISEKTKEMKLLYVPYASGRSGDKLENAAGGNGNSYVLPNFVHQMKRITSENGAEYLETLMRFLICENLNTERIIAFIEKLKQEIYECGIR